MKWRAVRMCCVVAITWLSLNGCANMPLKEGGLALDKHTTAGIDDIGVGRVTRQF